MKLYMVVTADEFELPMLVEEDYCKLAEWAGISPKSVLPRISRKLSGKTKGNRFVSVNVDDEDY